MSLIQQGFSIKYEVLKVSSIKPGEAGSFNGTPYSSSVKVRTVNISEKETDSVGIREDETILEFKIPCASNDDAKKLNNFLRSARASHSPLYFNADIPRKSDQKDVYNVLSFDHADVFMQSNNFKKEVK